MREGWTETTLGDVAETSWGNTSVTKSKYRDYGHTAFSASGPDGLIDWFEHEGKGVVLSAIGALCGKTWLADGKWTPIKNTIWLKSNSGENLDVYLYLLTQLPNIWPIRGQAQPFISLGDVRLVEVVLPPLAEQKRIVDVVSSVDTYISALQQQANAARTARNAVLHELLSAGGDDWSETTLGDVAVLNPKESALSADSPFIPMDAVHVGKRYIQYLEPRGDRNGARANTGDVLFARITPCLENGKVAQIQSGIERCGGSTEFIVIRGTNMFDSDFAYFWATWSETRNHAAGLMTGTTGRQRLSASDLGAMTVSLPPLVEQKRIVEIVSSMDDVIQSTEQAVADAKNLRSGVLSDLLSGEHEIPASYDVFVGAA